MKLQYFILAMLCPFMSMCQTITIKGKVADEEGRPVAGATVVLRTDMRQASATAGRQDEKGNDRGAVTDNRGEFVLAGVRLTDTIEVSAVGYETVREPVHERGLVLINLRRRVTVLDEAVVMAYGSTTRRLNTGNISKVSSAVIGQQAVSNPLGALQGRVPGLVVTQSNGLAGSGYSIRIRGTNSISQGNDPLIIIDGIPYAPNNGYANQLSSAHGSPFSVSSPGGISPLSLINPSDIASIEVLKDADATAIYGSRGANGVILITTKKGTGSGETRVEAESSQGVSVPGRLPAMLNTAAYLQMRRQGFANDGVAPTVLTAPDLLLWDTTRYTDWGRLLLGRRVFQTNNRVAVTGRSKTIQYSLGLHYQGESSVLPADFWTGRSGARLSLQHESADKRLQVTLTGLLSRAVTNLPGLDMAGQLQQPPNLPELWDSTGKLKWEEQGSVYDNPWAGLDNTYRSVSDNFTGNLQVSYKTGHGITLLLSGGYNSFGTEEEKQYRKSAQNPLYAPVGYADFGVSRLLSLLAEPQVLYGAVWGKWKVQVQGGLSFQRNESRGSVINASGYTTDALLGSVQGAATIRASNSYSQYSYSAFFGRVSLQYARRYLLNVSGRRDGSSRFGPGRQFANFGAVGAGWIFSEAGWIQRHVPFVSFGKLRVSYGVTGSDQIGNYQYLDSWTSTAVYQGQPGIRPLRLYNPDFQWEANRKFEAGLELGFLNNRVQASVSYYVNRSSNQLVSYALPQAAGFSSVLKNLAAVVENSGTEITLDAAFVNSKKIGWSSQFVFTLQRNRLVRFPGLAGSSYAATYVEGEPLSVIYGLHYTGVNDSTGLFSFADLNHDGNYTAADYEVSGSAAPGLLAGWGNRITAGRWSIDFFGEYRKQRGKTYLASISTPGTMLNMPVVLPAGWTKPGEGAVMQRYTAGTTYNDAMQAFSLMGSSDGVYGDASYFKLRNLTVSYHVPERIVKRIKGRELRVYCQMQNLFTITGYEAGDPETQLLYKTPTLRTITGGIQIIF